MSYLQWPTNMSFYSDFRVVEAGGSGTGNEQEVKEKE